MMMIILIIMVVKIILVMTKLVTAYTFPIERSVPGNGHKDCCD